MQVTIQIATDGAIEAASAEAYWVDAPMRTCVDEAIRALGSLDPTDGSTALHTVSLSFDHAADISFQTREGFSAPRDTLIADQKIRVQGRALDACAIRYPADTSTLRVKGRVRRSGSFRRATVLDSSGRPELDACVIEHLTTSHREVEGERLTGSVPGEITVTFFQLAAFDDGAPLPFDHTDPPAPPPAATRAQLQVIDKAKIRYPSDARDKRRHTRAPVTCTIRVHIEREGVPSYVAVGGCHEDFHASVEADMMKWRWSPPRLGGEPSAVSTDLSVTFPARR